MEKPPPYGPCVEEIPIKVYKSKEYPQRARGFSFLICVCSIFVYISFFYIFNLSPSTYLNDKKFWFFISNTLILNIAVDYGAFSSSGGNKHDVYEEYVMPNKASSVSSFVSQYPGVREKSVSEEEVEDMTEIKKEAVAVGKQKDLENKQEIVIRRDPEKNANDNFQEKKTDMQSAKKDVKEARNEKKLIEGRTYRRSKSDKPKRVVIHERKNNILRRSASEAKKEEHVPSEEENDFSSMSNEELNRRVEDFIKRFNRQIRLQNAGKFHEI